LVCTAKNPGRTMRISTQGHSYEASYRRVARRGVRLSYGKVFDLGPFACYSDRDGLSCYSERGANEGFFLSKESARLY
ncbi:hypothetical protein NL446_26485, partial [Klebsiella pneumoniae]|nr:hypothetical protein [Klebsiella pneumoniae]